MPSGWHRYAGAVYRPPAVIVPLTASAGTVTRSRFGEALVIVAIPPLNETVFCAGVGSNPLPKIDTAAPTLPWLGTTAVIATGSVMLLASARWIDSRLPTE